jgi:FKBP-type peptidyl-prolyl cis-trans isomerase FkpA
MKRIVTAALLAATLGTLAGCNDKPPPPPPPMPATASAPAVPPKPPPPPPLTAEDRNKALYAFGVLLVRRTPVAQLQLSEAELSEVLRGINDVTSGKEPAVKPEEGGPLVDRLLKSKEEERSAAAKKKGEAFLAKAATEKGAQKFPSGLIVITTKPGEGKTPVPTDTVKVNYRGTLTDGTEFDSSYKRNQPAEFPLGGVIKCWTEGLQKVKVGGKAKLVCPYDIAYGERGAPPNIPGFSTLVFEVELLEIKAPTPPAAPGAMPAGHPTSPPPQPQSK